MLYWVKSTQMMIINACCFYQNPFTNRRTSVVSPLSGYSGIHLYYWHYSLPFIIPFALELLVMLSNEMNYWWKDKLYLSWIIKWKPQESPISLAACIFEILYQKARYPFKLEDCKQKYILLVSSYFGHYIKSRCWYQNLLEVLLVKGCF